MDAELKQKAVEILSKLPVKYDELIAQYRTQSILDTIWCSMWVVCCMAFAIWAWKKREWIAEEEGRGIACVIAGVIFLFTGIIAVCGIQDGIKELMTPELSMLQSIF